MVKRLIGATLLGAAVMAATTSTETYKYAPEVKPKFHGNISLACVGVLWKDNTPNGADKADSVCRQVDSFFRRNSRGILDFKTQGFQVKVPFNQAGKNIAEATQYIKKEKPGFDKYAVILGPILTSHAGGGVAYLRGALYRDAQHEVGHLMGLGHAGAYKMVKGKMELDAYGDGESVMSRMPSPTLTAPQYYHQGYLPKTEAVIYEPGKTYTLKQTKNAALQALSVVILPQAMFNGQVAPDAKPGAKGVRDAYISHSNKWDKCAVLHLSQGGGSQRVQVICGEYYDDDFTGLHVKVLKKEAATITVSLDFAKKPAGFKAEDEPKDDEPEPDAEVD